MKPTVTEPTITEQPNTNKFKAKIGYKYLGLFNTVEEAQKAIDKSLGKTVDPTETIPPEDEFKDEVKAKPKKPRRKRRTKAEIEADEAECFEEVKKAKEIHAKDS